VSDKDEPFELNGDQIEQLIKLAAFRDKDVFYDLGSGSGNVVIQVAKQTHVKAIGIEIEKESYQKARKAAFKQLSKEQLSRTEFWYGDQFDKGTEFPFFYDIQDATVIYNSLHEDATFAKYYEEQLGSKHVRIITKDLPMVGYKSIANRCNSDCWLFLTSYPFKRIRRKGDWAKSILGHSSVSMEDVYHYYRGQMKKHYPRQGKYWTEVDLNLKLLVNARF
jgi:hypothetical protein